MRLLAEDELHQDRELELEIGREDALAQRLAHLGDPPELALRALGRVDARRAVAAGREQEDQLGFRLALPHVAGQGHGLEFHVARIDLDDGYIREAVEKGVRIAIGTDAHEKVELLHMEYGVTTCRRGWASRQDILNTLRRRYPLVRVVLAPCAVQGVEAPPQIVKALQALNAQNEVDVIIVARGGGSLEDLWAFNDEGVVRAIADSAIPVITGIGHETDFTLSDFAADVRAATPTAAAEQAVPDGMELREQLLVLSNRLMFALQQSWAVERGHLQDAGRRLGLQSPLWRVRNGRQRMDELQARLVKSQAHKLELLRNKLVNLDKRLFNLSPQAVLQRGYAIVKSADGALIKSVRQVRREDVIDIHVSDGAIISKVLTDPTQDDNGGISDGKE